MKKAVKRIFAGLFALALVLGSCPFSGSALAAGSKKVNGTFKMGTSCYDWGEAITSVVVDFKSEVDAKSVSTKDFKFTNDYSYFDYGVYANVEGTVEREVESVSVSGSKVTLNLKTVNNSQFLLTEMAEKTAKVELVSKVTVGGTAVDKKSTFTFKGTTNAIVDEFLDLETENLTYRLFVPKKLTGKNPLFVWIHGAGESGNNNRAQIVGNMVTNWAKDDAQAILDNAFILAPQYDGDRAVAGSWGHNPAWIMEAIQKTLREYDIDENRIYVGGCSMGGAGTVNMLKNYPNFFAAAFPICAAGELTDEDCAKIAAPAAKGKKATAIYLIHCIEDNTCNPNATFHMYSRLMNAYKALGVKESKAPVYAALFSECDYDGLMDGLQPYMSHFSWVYPQHNFDGLGDDYDGKNFISSNEKRDWYVKRDGESYDWCVEDGVIKFKDIVVTKATYDGEDVTSNYGWLPYQLPDYDESKLVKETKEEILTIKTVRPSEIGKGYANFLTWIAAQSLEKTFKVSAKAASGSHKLTWTEVKGAKKYVVFGGKEGSALVKLGTVSSAKFTNKKVSGAYEYVVYAYAKNANGKWERIGKSAKVSVK